MRAAEFFLKKKIALPFHHMHIITYTGVLVCDLLNVLLQMVKVDFFFWFGLYQVTTITTCPACWVVHRIVSKLGLNHQTKKSYWANRGHKILWSFTHTPSSRFFDTPTDFALSWTTWSYEPIDKISWVSAKSINTIWSSSTAQLALPGLPTFQQQKQNTYVLSR